jgi:hypothetical protein
MIALNA